MSDDTFRIESPNKDLTGLHSSVEFERGVGFTENWALAARFERKGYTVIKAGSAPVEPEPEPEPVEPAPKPAKKTPAKKAKGVK